MARMSVTEIDDARRLVDGAGRVVVLTGAGVSTASGIPAFRGPEGLWTKDPSAERLSHIDSFVSSSDLRIAAWGRMLERHGTDPQPNAAHRALVAFEERGKLTAIVTQNIDGLHRAAGSSADLVLEVHGSTRMTRCLTCGASSPTSQIVARVAEGDLDPHCRALVEGATCGGILKTAVVSFGQSLPREEFARAALLASQCDLMICVGSTLMVQPAAGLVDKATSRGARLVIVNADPTPYDTVVDVIVRADIPSVLGRILGVEAAA